VYFLADSINQAIKCIASVIKTKVYSETNFTRTHTFVFVNLHYMIFERRHPALGNLWSTYNLIQKWRNETAELGQNK